jgi:outer membrane protein assembly factor BamA
VIFRSGDPLIGARRPRIGPLAVLLFLSAVASARGEEPLRIGEVRVQSLDVFSPEEAAKGWFYRAANTIHMESRVSVIRKFLLFAPGDPFEQLLLEQTERNLRRLRFIKSASVTAGPPHDGVVDVDVVTQDSWTLDLGLQLGQKGGVTTWGVSLEERNLFGTGKEAGASYDKETERTNRSVSYHDPSFFAAYWTVDLTYADNTDGGQERVLIQKPFVSFGDAYASAVLFNHLRLQQNIYFEGEAVSRYGQNTKQGRVAYLRALEAGDTHARRLGLGFEYIDDRYSATTTYPLQIVPDDHSFRYISLIYQEERNDFLKLNYVNRDLRYEDFNMGPTFGAAFSLSPKGLGAPSTTFLIRAGADGGLRLGPRSFVQARVAFETRLDAGPKNTIVSATLSWVLKHETAFPQTTVSRLQFDKGWNLDKNIQFFADGETGLRGYLLHAFEGDDRLIWNLEHRIFSGKEILQLFSPGLAVFFDTGQATPRGQPLSFSNLKSDIGIGLRFGIARAAGNNIVRLDFAYALNADHQGRRGWLVSFSSGQSF